MTNKEKEHDIREAYNLIDNVLEDTDTESIAYDLLMDASSALWNWFEEEDI